MGDLVEESEYDTQSFDQLGLDSLDITDLLTQLECEYNINFDHSDYAVNSLESLIKLVSKKKDCVEHIVGHHHD